MENSIDLSEGRSVLPWIEKYRPSSLDEVISHKIIVETLRTFIEKNTMPHLLFYGPAGTGKTSAIIACAREIYKKDYEYMVMTINASEERGIDMIRNKIMPFSNSMAISFTENTNNTKPTYKLVILDEADSLTQEAQASLRRIIEKYTDNVRFCLICNYIKKIDPAIQSRCTCFRFAPLKYRYIRNRLLSISEEEKLDITEDGITTLIKRSKGDMRKILNILQSTSMAYPKITEDTINKCIGYPCSSDIKDILRSLLNDNFADAYNKIKKYKEDDGFSLSDIISEIHDEMIEMLMKEKLDQAIIIDIMSILGKIEYDLTSTINESIQSGALVAAFNLSKVTIK